MVTLSPDTNRRDQGRSEGTAGAISGRRRAPITPENRIKTFRWLFYMNLFQLLVFIGVPVYGFPWRYVPDMLMLAALTVGTIFATFSLLVNIYGLSVDKARKRLYVVMVVLMSGWLVWAAISWLYIEHMDYILR